MKYFLTIVFSTLLFQAFAQFTEEQDKSIDSLEKILARNQEDLLTAQAYVDLSSILIISNRDTVIPLAHKIIGITEKLLSEAPLNDEDKNECTRYLSNALNNLGYAYKYRGDIPRALEYYSESLSLKEEMGDKVGTGNLLSNIGLIYIAQGDRDKAREYLNKSLKLKQEARDTASMASTLNNLGMTYNYPGGYEQAISYFKQNLDIRRKQNKKEGMAGAFNNIGYIYMAMGNLSEALENYSKSLELDTEIGNKNGISSTTKNIGEILFKQNDLARAKEHANRALELAKELGHPNIMKNSAWLLVRIYKQENNFQKALELYEFQILMRDSLKNEATQKAMIRQQTKYEFEKAQLVKEQKEKEVGRLKEEARSRRDNLQYSIILIALMVIGGLLAVIGRFSIPIRIVEGLIFFSFLIIFEFMLVLADPYIEGWSGGAPGIKLLFNAGIAALIFPLHSLFETKLKSRMAR